MLFILKLEREMTERLICLYLHLRINNNNTVYLRTA